MCDLSVKAFLLTEAQATEWAGKFSKDFKKITEQMSANIKKLYDEDSERWIAFLKANRQTHLNDLKSKLRIEENCRRDIDGDLEPSLKKNDLEALKKSVKVLKRELQGLKKETKEVLEELFEVRGQFEILEKENVRLKKIISEEFDDENSA